MGGSEGAMIGESKTGDGGGGFVRDGRGVRRGEEEVEVARVDKVGGVGRISSGEIGFGGERHTEAP